MQLQGIQTFLFLMHTSHTNNVTPILTESVFLPIIHVQNFHVTELLHTYVENFHTISERFKSY